MNGKNASFIMLAHTIPTMKDILTHARATSNIRIVVEILKCNLNIYIIRQLCCLLGFPHADCIAHRRVKLSSVIFNCST